MKKYLPILTVLLVITLVFVFFYYQNKVMVSEQTKNLLSDFSSSQQINLDFYMLNFDMESEMTGLTAPDISCTGWRQEPVLLSEIRKGKPVLMFKYSELNCHTCYEASIKELQDVFHDFPEAAKILCAYRIEKDFIAFKKINIIKLDIYRILPDAFNWAAEKHNNPYYFVLHPDMKISNIYVPSKSFPAMNKAYLESIKRLLTE